MIVPVVTRTGAALAGLVLIASGLVALEASPAGAHDTDLNPLPVAPSETGESSEPFLTTDGQHVAFVSTATDLVAGDENGHADVFLATAAPGSDNPFSGAPVAVSVPDGAAGAPTADGDSGQPAASADGRFVVFTSDATDLVAGGTTAGRTHVYVRDTVANRTYLIADGAEPDGSSTDPDISDDGGTVVFTSFAANLVTGDDNGTKDAFIADLDANGDGALGDLSIRRVTGADDVSGGSSHPAISGNGAWVVYQRDGGLHRISRTATNDQLLATGAHDASIDATGRSVAYVLDQGCDFFGTGVHPSVVVSTVDISGVFSMAMGEQGVQNDTGTVSDPSISADASRVAWTTTRPFLTYSGPAVPLAEPVVRLQDITWSIARRGTVSCNDDEGYNGPGWTDTDVSASHATLSASGRTLAYSTPGVFPCSVWVFDTHTDALSVTSVYGTMLAPDYMTGKSTADIPASTLADFASAIANAPIYRLPIYRLPIYRLPIYRLPIYRLAIDDAPIYRLPIYRLPIYRLPIYRLDLPGGWSDVLADTPFAGELEQSVLLADVMQWAADTLASPNATEAEIAAAQRIRSLQLEDMDLSDSGIDSLSLASILLGAAPLADIPIAGQGTNIERWQSVVSSQGVALTVDRETLLADIDSAGVDIARTGVEDVPLRDLPIDATLFDMLQVHSADPASTPALFLTDTPLGALEVDAFDQAARTALFGDTPPPGTLADNQARIRDAATAADLAAGAPAQATLGTLLLSVLDTANYPWEQIAATSLDPTGADRSQSLPWSYNTPATTTVAYRFTFDAGPGETATFSAPTAVVDLPTGTRAREVDAGGSSPTQRWTGGEWRGALEKNIDHLRIPFDETPSGTSIEMIFWLTATTQPGNNTSHATLTSGDLVGEYSLTSPTTPVTAFDEIARNRVAGAWEDPDRTPTTLEPGRLYFEWITPDSGYVSDGQVQNAGPVTDEDWYLVDPAPPGKRLIVSTNAADGQLSLSLYRSAADAALSSADVERMPGTAVTEQSGSAGAPAEAGDDAGTEVAGQTLVDQAVLGGAGTATVEAAAFDDGADGKLLVRVASGDGRPSGSLYTLRASYVDEAPISACPARAVAGGGVLGTTSTIDTSTNTVYVFDQKRYGDVYGAAAAASVREQLLSLTGHGHVGQGTVQGAIIAVDTSPAVQSARDALDADPCSMPARRALTQAINTAVTSAIGDHADGIRSVVLVGGDDIIPLAAVPQHTSQFNEASHAAELRLPAPLGGGECPASVASGQTDPCATPLSAAAASNSILTDDPYGLPDVYSSLGGYVYAPTVGVGRLVETPGQIGDIIDRFIAADGELAADTALTGGYGAWAELPGLVDDALAWRTTTAEELQLPWDRDDLLSRLLPASGDAPRVVSVNTHADETRMLPGVEGAETGRFAETDLLTPSDVAAPDGASSPLAGSLLFLIGCHAGNNLPTAYYGDALDWVDVFSQAGGYVGNTGYGLANDVTTALSERLLALYAEWIGVQAPDGSPVSAGGALTYAKQSYLGGLGLYSGYDEKALMETVYYGLPMYTAADATTTKALPLPPRHPTLQPVVAGADGLSSASLTLTPTFAQVSVAGSSATYVIADDEPPLTVAGQPVLPRTTSLLDPRPDGLAPRGVQLTGLTSVTEEVPDPAFGDPTVGVPTSTARRDDVAFPATFATVTTQRTPVGAVDLLVATPGRVEIPEAGGPGVLERFTTMSMDVIYGPADAEDVTAPLIQSVVPPSGGATTMTVHVDGTGSTVTRVTALTQPLDTTTGEWTFRQGTPSGGAWQIDVPGGGAFRWIVQAVDGAGNVATDSARGQIGVGNAPAPTLGTVPAPGTVIAGEHVTADIPVTDAGPGEDLTASFRVSDDATGQSADAGVLPVDTGAEGTRFVPFDVVAPHEGTFTATVRVCRSATCASTSFGFTVLAANTAPTATVSLSGGSTGVDGQAYATDTLTAHATATDPDGDATTIGYRWTRNGVTIPGATSDTLALDGVAAPGDVVAVTVVPDDGTTAGHGASASVVVIAVPEGPQVVAVATNADGVVADGAWSRSTVTVSFACTSGVAVTECPADRIVADDTGPDGVLVEGTMVDALGREASAQVLVRVDATPPALSPTVTPATVEVGGAAVAEANATDSGSGIAAESCETPDTSTPGDKTVTCSATDVAGNAATADAAYTVGGGAAPVLCLGEPDRTPLPPYNADGSSVYPHGSGVPVVFRACDADGVPISTKKFVTGVELVSSAPLAPDARVNEFHEPPVQSWHFQPLRRTWNGSIPTKKLESGMMYTYEVSLSDGTSFPVTFGVL